MKSTAIAGTVLVLVISLSSVRAQNTPPVPKAQSQVGVNGQTTTPAAPAPQSTLPSTDVEQKANTEGVTADPNVGIACQPCPPARCVPQYFNETRFACVVECRPETRSRIVNYCEQIPETRTINEQFTVMTQETRKRQVNYVVSKPVWKAVTQEYTVQVPYSETRTATRPIRVPVTRTVTQEYTVQVPYSETRTATRPIQVPVKRNVTQEYTVQVPYCETRTATRPIQVPVTRNVTQKYTVQVPYCETRTATRSVCRMVPFQQTRAVCEDQGRWEDRPCLTRQPPLREWHNRQAPIRPLA